MEHVEHANGVVIYLYTNSQIFFPKLLRTLTTTSYGGLYIVRERCNSVCVTFTSLVLMYYILCLLMLISDKLVCDLDHKLII